MSWMDTLKFSLFNQGPEGQTFETEPGDMPIGNLPEGAYKSMFDATSGSGGGNLAGGIGQIAHGAGQIFGALNKKKDIPAPAAARSSYRHQSFDVQPGSERVPVREMPDSGPSNLRDIEQRLRAMNRGREEPIYKANYAGEQSIGGKFVPDRATAAFRAGYKYGK